LENRVFFKKAKITSHNRIVCVRRLVAARLRKTPVGLTPFVEFSLRHIPAHRKPTVCFIRRAGTSHTTRTLSEIKIEINVKII
jgi:hypothetical protein